MINTLCIETSGPHCSLALAVDGHIYCRDELLQRSHNQYLLPLLDELFHEAKITPLQLELVSFGCGPGSFTGVRIAAAATQGIATACGAKVVPLSSAWILAATAFIEHPELEQVICCIASRGQAFYLSAYRCETDTITGTRTYQQSRADELVDEPPIWLISLEDEACVSGKIALVGKLPAWLPDTLQDNVLDLLYPQAAVMIPAAQVQHLAGHSLSAELALPRYFAGDSPWRKSHTRGKATD